MVLVGRRRRRGGLLLLLRRRRSSSSLLLCLLLLHVLQLRSQRHAVRVRPLLDRGAQRIVGRDLEVAQPASSKSLVYLRAA